MNIRVLRTGVLALALAAAALPHVHGALCAEEDSVIKIRLSYKIILNPKDLRRPSLNSRVGERVSDEMIKKAVAEMNEFMASYWRGYRFELYEIREIGSLGGFYPDPSHWFEMDFVEQDKQCVHIKEMQAAIKADATPYAWSEEAVNIFINQSTSGAKWKARDLLVMGADSAGAGWLQLHELGHYFDLRHTHGGPGVSRPGRQHGAGRNNPGDDKVADTIEDLPRWGRDDLAKHNFFRPYSELATAQKESVDDVAENIMSYHFGKPMHASLHRLTEGQLDRWTDSTQETYRQQVRDGSTWFVDPFTLGNAGTSAYPYHSVNLAVAAANRSGGDIILLRPGAYSEAVTIDKPVTLRATRKGPASIGAAGLLAEEAK